LKKNEELQKDVQEAIKWEPLLNAAEIGVIAKDGVITLTGIVDSYTKKMEAEDAAKNVAGVKAVVEKIEVKFNGRGNKNDNEIAIEVLNFLKWNWLVSSEKIKVKVENGWVTLEGDLKWNYQKEVAKKTVCNIIGVKGVTNNIIIKSDSQDVIEKMEIERAFMRNWSITNLDIHVNVSGNKVILNGTVHSLYQKDLAGKIAWNAPGVWAVDNELFIEYNN